MFQIIKFSVSMYRVRLSCLSLTCRSRGNASSSAHLPNALYCSFWCSTRSHLYVLFRLAPIRSCCWSKQTRVCLRFRMSFSGTVLCSCRPRARMDEVRFRQISAELFFKHWTGGGLDAQVCVSGVRLKCGPVSRS